MKNLLLRWIIIAVVGGYVFDFILLFVIIFSLGGGWAALSDGKLICQYSDLPGLVPGNNVPCSLSQMIFETFGNVFRLLIASDGIFWFIIPATTIFVIGYAINLRMRKR